MESYTAAFLLQCRLRMVVSVSQHILVVAKFKYRFVCWNAHHSELESKSSYILRRNFHRTKFTSKHARLHTTLVLREPIDWGTIQKYHESSSRASSCQVTGMVAVNEYSHSEA